MKSFQFSQNTLNLFVGWCLYPLGDLIGQLLLGKFNLHRLLAMVLMGGLIYSHEIPFWFKWLDGIKCKRSQSSSAKLLLRESEDGELSLNWLGRTLGAVLYFNPLWIARHVALINLATNDFHLTLPLEVALIEFLKIGVKSFVFNLPISMTGNFIIQQKLPLKYRFAGSATLSGILSVAYGVEYFLFK